MQKCVRGDRRTMQRKKMGVLFFKIDGSIICII
jgi:hypothetical protein